MELAYKKQGFIVNKFLPCLLITMFAFMCLFGCCVNADNSALYNSTFNSLTTEYSNYFVVSQNTSLHAYFSNGNFYYNPSNSTDGTIRCDETCYFYYSNNGEDWVQASFSPISANSLLCSVSKSSTDFVLLSSDIYSKSGELVFQAPPQQVEGIIASQTQGVEMNRILQEIVAILPVVLVVIVGILAIRKAIQFLIQQMKHQ